ncbi:MAG: hypothetical protein DBX51_02200 [Clostridiales bacterium]|nr:MAG: hypothetical protein DBX51_02200 [Clostridiales bacterium]
MKDRRVPVEAPTRAGAEIAACRWNANERRLNRQAGPESRTAAHTHDFPHLSFIQKKKNRAADPK